MPQTILNGNALAAGLQMDFHDTWRQTYDGVERELGSAMSIDIPQATLTATWAYRESLPTPALWLDGDPPPVGGLESKSFSVTAFDYARRIEWSRNQRVDNQVGDLASDARTLGDRFARLDSKAFIEILTASATMLPAIPNAPDGSALYATSRFGQANGNLYTGTGTSVAQITTDWFGVLARFDNFQDTASEPLFEPNMGSASYTIFAGPALRKAMTEAFAAVTVHSVLSSTGAAVANAVQASGESIRIIFTSRISDNDWFVFRDDAIVKPVFSTIREPLRDEFATADNSDHTRSTKMEYIQFIIRKGYGVNIPYGTIKVNN